MGPTELAVGVEGDGASCACSRCGGRWGLLVWREMESLLWLKYWCGGRCFFCVPTSYIYVLVEK